MSESEGDFESADEEAVAPAQSASEKKAVADSEPSAAAEGAVDAPVVINQPPTAAQTDAAGPAVEVSYGGGGGGGGWTSWGLSWGQSLISGAKSGVSVLAKELGDGIGTVSRTVESVLDAPPPEEMAGGAGASADQQLEGASTDSTNNATAASDAAPSASGNETHSAAGTGGSWLQSSWRVGGALTTSVSQTGSYLVTGGLDLLEALGKRTMDALHETDPGFQRTKVLLGRNRRPNLSELLREAQASGAAAAAATSGAEPGPDGSAPSGAGDPDIDSPDFACQFDRLNGSAYLDGLQTLANQCELRLQAKLSTRPSMRPVMAQILERLERVRAEGNEDDDEEGGERRPTTLESALSSLPDQYASANAWLSNAVAVDCLHGNGGNASSEETAGSKDVAALQVDCVRRLAALTAATIHYLLKAASLASAAAVAAAAAASAESDAASAAAASAKSAASALAGLCFALIGCADAVRERACLSIQAAANAGSADDVIDEHAINQAMTQVILEAEGAKAYLQDAFILLAPVLQLAALEEPVSATTAQ